MTAREALLRWARRSTARYPGVRVTDFTGSWRDGLAFSALIHRNRPDLVDWRNARASQPRERLDRVFNVAEREYGVTRLLDPEGNINNLLSLVPVFSARRIYIIRRVSARRRFDRDRFLLLFHLFLLFFPFPSSFPSF